MAAASPDNNLTNGQNGAGSGAGTALAPFGQPQAPRDPVAERLANLDPIDLSLNLPDDQKMRLAHRLCGEIDQYRREHRRRLENLNVWRLNYECFPPGTSTRWENSGDVNSSLTRIYCNAHHTRLNNQLLGAVPPFAAVAREPAALEAAPLIEDCMTAVLDQAEWPQVADDKNRELVVAGNVFIRTTYERDVEAMPRKLVDVDDEQLDSLLRAGADLHDAVGHATTGVSFGHYDQLTYDGVRFKVIKWEDGIILPSLIRDPAQAYGIGERVMLSGFQLMDGVRQGYYDREAVEELLKHRGDPEPEDRRNRLDEQGMQEEFYGGYPGSGDPDDALYHSYEIYELCWKMVPPEKAGEPGKPSDARPVWTVVHLHPATRRIIGHQFLEYEHGRPYYQLHRYIIRTNELWGAGIPELIAGIHDADTAVGNQLIDHNDWSLNLAGNWLYTGMSGYNPDKTIAQFGRGIKLDDLNEMKQIEVPPIPQEAYRLRDGFKNEGDLLTASSNPSLGKETTGDKTLGEVQIVTHAATQIFSDYSARVARQEARLFDEARWLFSQYGLQNEAGEITYRRTAGPDRQEFASITPQMLSSKVDLVPTGLEQLSDMATKVQVATLVLTQLLHLPIAAGNMEVQRIAVEEYLRATKYSKVNQVLAAIDRGLQAQMRVQQLEMAHAAQGGMAPPGGPPPGGPPPGPGGPPGAGGGPPAPPGSIGGAPAPIPGPPELPPGATASTQALPPVGGQ